MVQADLTHGEFVGTPNFASPEQFGSGPVDARSDIYSLGATLWFALTGLAPHSGSTIEEIRDRQTRDDLPVEQLVARKIPAPVIKLLRRLLAVDPAQRPASARELMEKLEFCRQQLTAGSGSGSFFSQLKQRNVVRVAIAYGVTAWLLAQIATQIFPFFEMPNWGVRLVILVLGIGFPIALALAWAFEITPEGIMRMEEGMPNESSRRRTRYTFAVGITIVTLAAVGLFAFRLSRQKPSPAPISESAAAVSSEKSIAVLPLENLSADQENSYFADGLQDDVLTSLAKIGALKVISRTSVAQYRGAGAARNLRGVAQELGVENILEGSVRRTGDRVRVSVRLIDARTERQLWAESYDRAIADSLTLQGELAREIAGAMRVALSPEEKAQIETKPTQNAEAYMLYLRGLASSSRASASLSATDMSIAVKCFQDAVKLDPNFALAWAKLSRSLGWLYPSYGTAAHQKDAIRQAAETAARLQPDAEETALAQAYYELRVKLDYAAARAYFERARRIAPNNSEASAGLADVALAQGHWSEYLPLVRESRRLDPRNPVLWAAEARFLRRTKQYAAANHALDEALRITPDDAGLISQKATLFQVQGDLQNSRAWLSRRQIKLSDPESIRLEDTQWLMERRPELAVHAWQTVLGNPDANPGIVEWQRYFLGRAQLLARDVTGARKTWLQARTEMEAQVKEDPANAQCVMQVARIYAGLGEKAAALREGEHALQLLGAGDAWQRINLETVFAQLQAEVGDKERAMDVLERLITMPSGPTLAELRLHPDWDPLREHPRFQKLLAGPEPKTVY